MGASGSPSPCIALHSSHSLARASRSAIYCLFMQGTGACIGSQGMCSIGISGGEYEVGPLGDGAVTSFDEVLPFGCFRVISPESGHGVSGEVSGIGLAGD